MNSIKKFLKDLNIKEYYNKANQKTEFFEPTFIITLTLLFGLIVICSMKSIMGDTTNVVIANNIAEEYFYEGKYEEALSEYERMQQKEQWPSYKLKMAEIHSIKGEYDKSNNLLKESMIIRNKLVEDKIKYIEEDKEFINNVVFTFYMNGQYEEAISIGEDYLENVNSYKPLVQTLYSIYLTSGQTHKAESMLKSYSLDEKSVSDLSNYSKMQMMIGNFDEGLTTLKKAWDLDRNEVRIFDSISEVLYYDKDQIINKIIEFDQKNIDEPFYKVLKAKVYSLSKETVDLAEETINSIDDEISLVNINMIKGQVYTSQNRKDEGKKAFEEVIEYDKDSFLANYLEGWNYYNQGDYNKAYEYAKKSIIDDNTYYNTWGLLIPEVMNQLKKPESVDGYFRVALNKNPLNYNLIIKIAEYYKDIKLNYDKAKEYYLIALGMNPKKDEVYYNLASVELLRENYEVAAEYLESAVSINTLDSKYYRTLSYVYLQIGDNEKAIENIRNTYALNENDLLNLNNAACYYITVEDDIWRAYSNIEATYNEIPANIDEESKKIITENYNKIKDTLNKYLESDETILNIPQLKFIY